MSNSTNRATITIRNMRHSDIDAVVKMTRKVYPDQEAYTSSMLRGQLNAFPEGQLIVLSDDIPIGYAATFRISERRAFSDHDWVDITGDGHASRHNPKGEWLYGMEICVDPSSRRLRIGNRLYNARLRLCQELKLKGIVFGGRMPGYAKAKRKFKSPEAYLDAVNNNELNDAVINFQKRMGFEARRILHDYMPDDRQSGGHATLMVWQNPDFDPDSLRDNSGSIRPDLVRIVCVQQAAEVISTPDDFYRDVEYFVGVASDYKGDFVLFPELFTLQLLSGEKELEPHIAIQRMSEHTAEFIQRLSTLSVSKNINIIGGSHPTIRDDGNIQNVAYVFLRDGSVHTQDKIHPTPDEKYWWNIKGGDEVNTIDTDCGSIGVMVCYDSEFPEISRRLVDQGAQILFVPYCTDTRQGHLRVKYCCQARAVENQIYVATAGLVGSLENVANIDINYAQSAIYTPCDFPFARDGIAAEATENVEMVTVADVNLSTLRWARAEGSVRNLHDRRLDLYRTRWKRPSNPKER